MEHSNGLSWAAITAIGGLLIGGIGLLWTISHAQFKTINGTLVRIFEKIEGLIAQTSAINERCLARSQDHERYEKCLSSHGKILAEHDTAIGEHERRICTLEENTETDDPRQDPHGQ